MRCLIMHTTNERWEAGERPGAELIARVGSLMGELSERGLLLDGAGLRASALGARLSFSDGQRVITPGPFAGPSAVPARFAIVRTKSLDEAIDWATRVALAMGDQEVDVRPVTEAWDIGLAPRPPDLTTTRFMLLSKASAASESGVRRATRIFEEMTRAGVLLTSETLSPSARGKRFQFASGNHTVMDGPFTESKELIAGYVLIRVASLEEAMEWTARYGETVESTEVDLRAVEDPERA